MKTQPFLLALLIVTNTSLGVVALPSATGTNYQAASANQIREASERYFTSGNVAQLQREVDTLQIEFLILAIAVGAAGSACLLTIRGQVRKAGHVRGNHAKELHANQ